MERLHNYVFGEPVRVQTDHKPLEVTWKKRIATASPRLKRLLLRLTRYEIQVEYNRLDRTRNATRVATTADPALNQLRHCIFHGWLGGRFRDSNSQNDCSIIGITVKNL